jgi:hypothetical protein
MTGFISELQSFRGVAETVQSPSHRVYHRRLILGLLLLMILVNVAFRYPLDHAVPYGSDTFTMLDLSRLLANDGRATWILSPASYIGLYPLSYPSGVPFSAAELQMLCGMNWNAVPLTFSIFISTFFVLASFLLFRQFRLGDELSVLLAGMMALSPIFIFFTYEQLSGRSFVMPLFLLSLYLIFWSQGRMASKMSIFLLFTVGLFSLHRTSFMLLVMELIAAGCVFVSQALPRVNRIAKPALYVSIIALGVLLLVWPLIPGLRDVFSQVPEIAFSYRMGEWQFSSGLLFMGDSIPVLLGNLAVNYVGSMGLALLMLPLGLTALYPKSKSSIDRDLFPLVTLVIFSPMIWQAYYMQLILLPFAYLLFGLAIARRRRIVSLLAPVGRRVFRRSRSRRVLPKNLWASSISLFLVACLVFSGVLFIHRIDIREPVTEVTNWPSDSEANLGLYLGGIGNIDHRVFVSGSDMLDRRVRWFSEWQSPVTDSVVLEGSGYLNATSRDFSMSSSNDYPRVLLAFFDFQAYYTLNKSLPNIDLYKLSYYDIYGFFRLYYLDRDTAYASPQVSTSQAGISVVLEIDTLGDSAHNLYFGEGALPSAFLREVSSSCYTLFENDHHIAFLVANPVDT